MASTVSLSASREGTSVSMLTPPLRCVDSRTLKACTAARAGLLQGFKGVDALYEVPPRPEAVVRTKPAPIDPWFIR